VPETALLIDEAPPAPAPLRVVPECKAVDAPPPERRLEIPPYDLAAALALRRRLGVGHVLAQVLVRRGLGDPDAARDFLEPSERHDPSCFAGIERASETIRRHLHAGSRIVVHGDYDVDGICATAILVRGLRWLGADVGWFLPSRVDDGYGLSAATVERLAARGTALLVTVDCGITAVAEVTAATAAGMDVVITDHHAPRADGQVPDCPIVHPALCGYPCAELCGTAVAFKLGQALGAPTEAELELVALATVADLMPLRGENRRLVRDGLAAMANTTRPGLRALMTVSRTDPSDLDASSLGFRLAPRINAAGRLRRADAGLELLLTQDSARAREIAEELDAVNAERRAVEQRILWEAEAQVQELGERSAYVLAGRDWHPGVVGIVASRIVERHHRPAVLIALGDGEKAPGSGRSIPGFDLLGALHACAEHLIGYGGHRAAAGLTVSPERIDALRGALEAHAQEVLTPDLLTPVERVDAVVCGSELGLELAEELARLEPCGMGNPRPRLLVAGARLDDVRSMGEGRHARFSVSSGGARARGVAFGCEGNMPGGDGQPLDATFSLERNVWNGAVEPRLVLRHARPCTPAPIELPGGTRYLQAVFAELDRPLAIPQPDEGGADAPGREVLDRRGQSPLAVLADARAASGGVLAVCIDVPRRLPGLAQRAGGFALVSYAELSEDPVTAREFGHLVALDPPASPEEQALLRAGSGYTHLAWGEPELRFALQMHEFEHDLRAPLVELYRRLKARQSVTGEELERLLGGEGQHRRPPRLAGRLVRILSELDLVRLNPSEPAIAIASQAPTALDRSPTYRLVSQRCEEGRRFLSSASLRPSA